MKNGIQTLLLSGLAMIVIAVEGICFASCGENSGDMGDSGSQSGSQISDNSGGSQGNIGEQEHIHSWSEWKLTIRPTCMQAGEEERMCKGDATHVEKRGVSASGHSFINYISDNNATCTLDGTKTAKCERCDETETVVAENSKKGHRFTGDLCSECGAQKFSEGLKFTLSNDKTYYSISKGSCVEKDVIIPSIYEGLPVKELDVGAFEWSDLIKITIPEGVTAIGDQAFFECKNLTEVVLPNSVTKIGGGAFCECSALQNIVIPNGVTEIKGGTFISCSSLTKVVLPDHLTRIGNQAFINCGSLTQIDIPESVTDVENEAFCQCKSLTSVVFPVNVTRIGKDMFSGCVSLMSVTLGSKVTYIGTRAFYRCISLTNIVLPDSVTTVEAYAFQSCSALKSVNIGSGVLRIENNAFVACVSIADVYYNGTKDEWSRIFIGGGNDYLNKSYKIHFVE